MASIDGLDERNPPVDVVVGPAGDPDLDALEPEDEAKTGRLSPSAKSALEWAAVVVCALTVALVVKTFLIQAFYIPSGSMLPTLQLGDRVLVNKLDDSPSRGDIVVFERPASAGASSDGINDLIKRVVGLPGESIEGRDGAIYIDGERLVEPYLPDGTLSRTFGPIVISDDAVFVLGDNRNNSQDSTKFGEIKVESIIGRAFIVIWPPSDFGGL